MARLPAPVSRWEIYLNLRNIIFFVLFHVVLGLEGDDCDGSWLSTPLQDEALQHNGYIWHFVILSLSLLLPLPSR